MKNRLLFTTFLIALTLQSVGQMLPYVGGVRSFIFPNKTNEFITAGNVSWALDIEETFSFRESNKFRNQNVFDYLITEALSEKVKAYTLWHGEFEGFENSVYSDHNKFPHKNLTKDDINYLFRDSLKTIKFHEIFYLNNYSLNCQIISAAPSMNYATASGVNVGIQPIFYCCKSTNDPFQFNKNKDIVHLKKVERNLNLDSIVDYKLVKQTYGLNLVQSIWSGASQGYINLYDITTSEIIPTKNVLNYSYLDSVQVAVYDSTGSITGYNKQPGQAVFPYKLVNSLQFTQDFYYDVKQNIFITTISDCYVLVKNWDEVNFVLKIEKRFKVL